MKSPPTLAARLRAGDTVYSAWLTIPEPIIAEAVAALPFDAVAFDVQHGLHDFSSVMRSVTGIAAAGKPAIVRIALGDHAGAARLLDVGAEAIVAPMISSAAEARALVAATKYPPLGERSWGPNRALSFRGLTAQEHLERANAYSLVFAMIETRTALDAMDEILAVDGIDGAFVGPSDLSISWFGGAKIAPLDPALDEPIALVAAKARAAGKLAGIFSVTADRARHFHKMGYRLIALGSDQAYLERGAREMLAEAGGG